MTRSNALSFIVVFVAISALLATTAQSQLGQTRNYVALQPSTPGTSQSGHAAISGRMTAGSFSGNGSLLTSIQLTLPHSQTAASGLPLLYMSNTSNGPGIRGQSASNTGVFGVSTSGRGIYGISGTDIGVWGETNGSQAATVGWNNGSGVGVEGFSASNSGILGRSNNGRGIFGKSTTDIGVYGEASGSQAAIFGINLGTGRGVFGKSMTEIGVFAETHGSQAASFAWNLGSGPGVEGSSNSSHGVYGRSTTGRGVYGKSTSDIGVWGEASGSQAATVGFNTGAGPGVHGFSSSNSGVSGNSNTGRGMYGKSVDDIGVWGETNSDTKSGVTGMHLPTGNYGVLGHVNDGVVGFTQVGHGAGASGYNTANGSIGYAGGASAGILGVSGTTPWGVASANNSNSVRAGLWTTADDSGAFETFNPFGTRVALISNVVNYPRHGAILVVRPDNPGIAAAAMYVSETTGLGYIYSDVKSFVVPNPRDDETVIQYACIEGPEAAAYVRGTGSLVNGRASIDLPEYFTDVAAAKGMTVQLTPLSGRSRGLCVTSKSPERFVVEELNDGRGSYDFDYVVMAVRKGHEDYKVIRPRTEFAGNQGSAIKLR